MKEELVFVKSNFIGYNFKKLGEYVNPDKASFDKAIEHKIFMSPKQAEKARANKKMLCSFLTVRVIGDNSLMTVIKDPAQKCVVLDIPVTRGMFKRNPNDYAFLEAVKNYVQPLLSIEELKKTHLVVSGVVNHEALFGMHYTLLVPKEVEKTLKASDFPNGKTFKITTLQKDTKLDELSKMCMKNCKEAKENDNAEHN